MDTLFFLSKSKIELSINWHKSIKSFLAKGILDHFVYRMQ